MTTTANRKTRQHDQPAIDFKDAPNFYVTYIIRSKHTAVTESLSGCPSRIFAQLALKATKTATKPEACVRELEGAGLDYRYDQDKWYALLLLERHHCQAFWSRFREVYA